MQSKAINPKISVIVAVYNVEKYLRECLESLIHQTLKDIEIICVNDGSTDNSLGILKEYASKDNRIIVFSQENSGGPGGPRNIALKIAKGEFINITDPDDYRALDSLEKLYNAAKKYNVDSAFGDIYRISESGTYCGDFIDPRPYDKVLDASTSFDNSIYLVQSIFKRNKIENVKYILNTDYEDSPFGAEVLMNIDNIVHVRDAIYFYRSRRNSSAGGKTERIFKVVPVLDKMNELIDKYKDNRKIGYLKDKYKWTVEFLLKKCFFTRMPDVHSSHTNPYIHIYMLFCRFLPHMNLKQKVKYLFKIMTVGTYKYLIRYLIRIEKREYCKYLIILSKCKIKLLRKHGKSVKKMLRGKNV